MSEKEVFVQTVVLSRESKTTVKFAENLELTCLYSYNDFYYITNVIGDFEITKIFLNYKNGSKSNDRYDIGSHGFKSESNSCSATFYITPITFKEMCAVPFQLQIPSVRLRCLKLHHFFKEEFVLPGYDELKFTYYIKKVNESKEKDIEIHVLNPYDVEIQGQKGDFRMRKSSESNIDFYLLIGFYPCDKSLPASESSQVSAVDESRPKSVNPSLISSNETTLLHKLSSNNRFADVYFVTSDQTKIPSHRCILAEFSNIFAKIFEESTEIPVQITIDDFNAETVKAALNFLYGTAINGKETEVFKFAVQYGIYHLIDACISFFEESVSPSNVCEFIQIAYSYNFDKLKQRCLRILDEKKKEIDSAKVAELPKNILFDAFCV